MNRSFQETLDYFLRYCGRQSPSYEDMQVFLTETDLYFLLEIKVESYDGALEPARFYDDGDVSDETLNHPFVVLTMEMCEEGHFAEIQSTTEKDSYGVNIEIQDKDFTVEHFGQEIQVNDKETLYMFAFDSNVSTVWEGIRSFVQDKDTEYYINTIDGETIRLN